jgi:hypothetical protein
MIKTEKGAKRQANRKACFILLNKEKNAGYKAFSIRKIRHYRTLMIEILSYVHVDHALQLLIKTCISSRIVVVKYYRNVMQAL